MMTISTLLSGGEGIGVGARDAGLAHLWGIEIEDDRAQVARDNGFSVITESMFDIDPHTLQRPDVLHASPQCKNASQANASGKESADDIEMAECIIRYVEVLRPKIFTLENVYPYRKFESFKIIQVALGRLGYFFDFGNLNSADFGVPQTRRRLILRAVHGGLVPQLPPPCHWIGWYAAIEDLISSLPDSKLAPWQLKRLPEALSETALLSQGISRDHAGKEYPMRIRSVDQPAFTVTANANMNSVKAFLVTGQYGTPMGDGDRLPQVRGGERPAFTVTATNKGDWKAFIVDGGNAGRVPTVRYAHEPMFTVDAMRLSKHPKRAVLPVAGRVVQMTTHALARFQSFPDSYKLPDESRLASRVIGNAVPPLMYRKIIRSMVSCLDKRPI